MNRTPMCHRGDKSTKTGKALKSWTDQMAKKIKNGCHIPDLVQAFSEETMHIMITANSSNKKQGKSMCPEVF